MALVDQFKQKENPKGGKQDLSEEEETDVALATTMGATALGMPEAQQALDGMLESADPILAAGQFAANLVMSLKEQAMKQKVPLSDNIWLAENGVLDRIVDEIVQGTAARTGNDLSGQEQKIWLEALNVFKLAAKQGQAASQRTPQGQQAAMAAPAPVGANIGIAAPAMNGGM